jgi:hypothetical protein
MDDGEIQRARSARVDPGTVERPKAPFWRVGREEVVMLRTPVRTMQTIRDCRWSRPGNTPPGFHVDETEPLWVCVRPTGTIVRRPVTEEECENCPHWEMNATLED